MSINRSLLQTQLLELYRYYPGSTYSDGCITVQCPALQATFTLFLSNDYPWSAPLIYIAGEIPSQLRSIVDQERRVKFPPEGQWIAGTELVAFVRQLEQSINSKIASSFNPEEAKKRITELKGSITSLQQSNISKQEEILRSETDLYEDLRSRLAVYAQQSESLLAAYRAGHIDAAAFQQKYVAVRTGWHQVQSLLTCVRR